MRKNELTIPPPAPDRAPLKANVFEFAQNSVTTLAALFPYTDAGSIVPCVSVFRGGPGRRYGRFQHFNTVDEVIMLFGGLPGLVRVGPKLHPVSAPFPDAEDPNAGAVALITQRQLIGKPHREEYRFLCDQCDRRLSMHRFDTTPAERSGTNDQAPFVTILEGYEAAVQHNAKQENLVCPHCGHENELFPVEEWGWEGFAHQSEVAANARAQMSAATASAQDADEERG